MNRRNQRETNTGHACTSNRLRSQRCTYMIGTTGATFPVPRHRCGRGAVRGSTLCRRHGGIEPTIATCGVNDIAWVLLDCGPACLFPVAARFMSFDAQRFATVAGGSEVCS